MKRMGRRNRDCFHATNYHPNNLGTVAAIQGCEEALASESATMVHRSVPAIGWLTRQHGLATTLAIQLSFGPERGGGDIMEAWSQVVSWATQIGRDIPTSCDQ